MTKTLRHISIYMIECNNNDELRLTHTIHARNEAFIGDDKIFHPRLERKEKTPQNREIFPRYYSKRNYDFLYTFMLKTQADL